MNVIINLSLCSDNEDLINSLGVVLSFRSIGDKNIDDKGEINMHTIITLEKRGEQGYDRKGEDDSTSGEAARRFVIV